MKESILGVDVCPISMKEAVEEAKSIVETRKPKFIVAINPEKIMKAQKDTKLMWLLNSADLQIPDGIGVVIASKLRGGKVKKRVTGIDMMMNICGMASENGYRVYLLGASPGVAETAASKLKERFKNLCISGTHDGYFQGKEKVIIDDIKSSNSDILFVALGSPKQENWIKTNMDILNVPLIMGVGGSYDVVCGNIKRAPLWMRRTGLEWLYRLISEPWRIRRMTALPVFLFKVICSKNQGQV